MTGLEQADRAWLRHISAQCGPFLDSFFFVRRESSSLYLFEGMGSFRPITIVGKRSKLLLAYELSGMFIRYGLIGLAGQHFHLQLRGSGDW
jgi:hypothetical protein